MILDAVDEITVEDMIAEEDVAISITHSGYIKRTSITHLPRASARGGRGRMGMRTKDEDFVDQLFIASTHSYVLIFTDRGRVYWLKVHEIPEVGPAGPGQGGGEPGPARAAGEDRGLRHGQGVRSRALRAAGHPQGHREEDRARRLLQPAPERASSPWAWRTTTRSSRPCSPRARTRSCSPPARAWPSTSARRTCGPWAARPTG